MCGSIKAWYTDDVPKRFASYGWQVIANVDGHDVAAVHRAIGKAKRETARPTLICCTAIDAPDLASVTLLEAPPPRVARSSSITSSVGS